MKVRVVSETAVSRYEKSCDDGNNIKKKHVIYGNHAPYLTIYGSTILDGCYDGSL